MGVRNLRIAAVTIDREGFVDRHPIVPTDLTDIFVERFRRRAGKLRYRHQHPIRRPEPKVRPVERFQSALKMHTADGGPDILGTDRHQFLCNERFRFFRRCREKACIFHFSIAFSKTSVGATLVVARLYWGNWLSDLLYTCRPSGALGCLVHAACYKHAAPLGLTAEPNPAAPSTLVRACWGFVYPRNPLNPYNP